MSSTPESADPTPGGDAPDHDAPDEDAPDQDAPDQDDDAPLTRREMKERGIALTSEAAPAAEISPPNASPGDSDEEDGEASDDTMSTGRRPVVLAPLTARGIRTVDESGAITGVQAAVGRAVQSATSPASWESAVALPAVALGIADLAGAPEAVQEDEQRAAESTDEGHVADGGQVADAGHPSDGGPTDAGHARGAPVPAVGGPTDAGHAPGAPAPTDGATAADVGEAPRPAIGPRAMTIRVGIVLAILIVGVVVIYLISTGALGSVLAQTGPGEAGGAAGTLAVALRSLRRPRAAADRRPEEFCDC